MANPIFNQFGRNVPNPFSQLMAEVEAFKKTFKGSPKEEVQRLLNSGEMTQEQFNEYSKFVQNMGRSLGMK